ncbi:uncharacterized protein CTHT_0028440 [Thermochaetoides thermophila DSM 1495]|uniref:Uncharacterized protein n=1 Tax=Chaetomium thermophilum (strain DSM 1495 / CBS 144.50 / IMI 039719) TaxID=759272 RepID=G0S7Q4_CHATD|nr:hypothetical protein CTHT_0028440 [Thermochaetoides thermophila DSM 1495]EGS21004.1 hypothetical protein CTHT_0028440 [Thermochaetoides thermophila DSM 1495]
MMHEVENVPDGPERPSFVQPSEMPGAHDGQSDHADDVNWETENGLDGRGDRRHYGNGRGADGNGVSSAESAEMARQAGRSEPEQLRLPLQPSMLEEGGSTASGGDACGLDRGRGHVPCPGHVPDPCLDPGLCRGLCRGLCLYLDLDLARAHVLVLVPGLEPARGRGRDHALVHDLCLDRGPGPDLALSLCPCPGLAPCLCLYLSPGRGPFRGLSHGPFPCLCPGLCLYFYLCHGPGHDLCPCLVLCLYLDLVLALCLAHGQPCLAHDLDLALGGRREIDSRQQQEQQARGIYVK